MRRHTHTRPLTLKIVTSHTNAHTITKTIVTQFTSHHQPAKHKLNLPGTKNWPSDWVYCTRPPPLLPGEISHPPCTFAICKVVVGMTEREGERRRQWGTTRASRQGNAMLFTGYVGTADLFQDFVIWRSSGEHVSTPLRGLIVGETVILAVCVQMARIQARVGFWFYL